VFRSAGRYLEHYHQVLSTQLLRLALIRPAGVEGAAIAGAFEVLRRPYPVRVFATAAEGYTWLATEHGTPSWPADAAVLAELQGEASNTPRLIGELRVLVERNLVGLPVGEAAKRLGVSERTLQRKLGEHDTTYQDEVADARLRAAKQLLATTDTPITNIALTVGFASLQHFSALFHKRESMSPSDYRRRARATR
jgi:transcriptional regulator GlxA family with amidase domain